MKLGVNLDHVATLRQARYRGGPDAPPGVEPELFLAVQAAEKGGADGITLHLREDRRHIQDEDVWMVREECSLPLNLEMSLHPEIVKIALELQPDEVCLVPERREEVTTEGGLNVVKNLSKVKKVVRAFNAQKIPVSVFISPVAEQVRAAASCGAEWIELNTGGYAENWHRKRRVRQWLNLRDASELAQSLGLRVNAGHGLNYRNIGPALKLPNLETLNIGHTIVSRALMVGMEKAVREMARIVHSA